jgi:hypothetical protein
LGQGRFFVFGKSSFFKNKHVFKSSPKHSVCIQPATALRHLDEARDGFERAAPRERRAG